MINKNNSFSFDILHIKQSLRELSSPSKLVFNADDFIKEES